MVGRVGRRLLWERRRPTSTRRPPPGAPADEREIVYTADVVVRVGDVEQASATATGIAEEAEGYLAGQDAQLEGDQESTLTIRVPSDRFRPVLDQLTDLGTVQQRQIGSTDVTEEVGDLSGRLESVRTSADRLRTLLAEAPGTEQVIAIEQELAERESQIESLEGRLRVLDDQTSLATITVRFTEKAEPPEVDEDLPGFVQALKAGGVAVVTRCSCCWRPSGSSCRSFPSWPSPGSGSAGTGAATPSPSRHRCPAGRHLGRADLRPLRPQRMGRAPTRRPVDPTGDPLHRNRPDLQPHPKLRASWGRRSRRSRRPRQARRTLTTRLLRRYRATERRRAAGRGPAAVVGEAKSLGRRRERR